MNSRRRLMMEEKEYVHPIKPFFEWQIWNRTISESWKFSIASTTAGRKPRKYLFVFFLLTKNRSIGSLEVQIELFLLFVASNSLQISWTLNFTTHFWPLKRKNSKSKSHLKPQDEIENPEINFREVHSLNWPKSCRG